MIVIISVRLNFIFLLEIEYRISDDYNRQIQLSLPEVDHSYHQEKTKYSSKKSIEISFQRKIFIITVLVNNLLKYILKKHVEFDLI